jgi:hypothetical protein
MDRGSAIARIAGHNAKKHSDLFEEEVKIWVFEEEVRFTLSPFSVELTPSLRERN